MQPMELLETQFAERRQILSQAQTEQQERMRSAGDLLSAGENRNFQDASSACNAWRQHRELSEKVDLHLAKPLAANRARLLKQIAASSERTHALAGVARPELERIQQDLRSTRSALASLQGVREKILSVMQLGLDSNHFRSFYLPASQEVSLQEVNALFVELDGQGVLCGKTVSDLPAQIAAILGEIEARRAENRTPVFLKELDAKATEIEAQLREAAHRLDARTHPAAVRLLGEMEQREANLLHCEEEHEMQVKALVRALQEDGVPLEAAAKDEERRQRRERTLLMRLLRLLWKRGNDTWQRVVPLVLLVFVFSPLVLTGCSHGQAQQSGQRSNAKPRGRHLTILLDETDSFVVQWDSSVQKAAQAIRELGPGDSFTIVAITEKGWRSQDVLIPYTRLTTTQLLLLRERGNYAKQVLALKIRPGSSGYLVNGKPKGKPIGTDILGAVDYAAFLSRDAGNRAVTVLVFSDFEDEAPKSYSTHGSTLQAFPRWTHVYAINVRAGGNGDRTQQRIARWCETFNTMRSPESDPIVAPEDFYTIGQTNGLSSVFGWTRR